MIHRLACLLLLSSACALPAAEPAPWNVASVIDRGGLPYRVHVFEDFETTIEKRWWLRGRGVTKNLPESLSSVPNRRSWRAVQSKDFDRKMGDRTRVYKAVVFNPVPGPPMGKRTRLSFRYRLEGTDTLRVQLYSLTNNYHRYLVLRGLPQGQWQAATVDMTEARRPDGSGGPLSEDERIDDIQFYIAHGAELTIDDIVLYEWFEVLTDGSEQPLGDLATLPVVLPLGSHTIGLRVTDTQGESASTTTNVLVQDTNPPLPVCVDPPATECSGPAGASVALIASASDVCSPIVVITNDRTAGGADASGIYPLGTTPVGFTASDEAGNMAACTSSVVVKDETPPAFNLTAEPAELWPPNHRMVDVTVVLDVGDLCGPATVDLESLSSSEPDDAAGNGDGKTTGDFQAVTDQLLQLRAERSGAGQGRVYTAIYRATDDSGNVTVASLLVPVPHNVGGSTEPMLIVAEHSIAGTVLAWADVPGALLHNVVRGNVERVREKLSRYDLGQLTCIASGAPQNGTAGFEDAEDPDLGKAFLYLAEYYDGTWSGLGTESAAKERSVAPGQANCR